MSKEYRQYKKLVKRYRKLLIKQARQAVPFDEKPLLEMLVTYLHFFKDYYTEDNNVHTFELDGHNRLKEISLALDNWYAVAKDEEDYYNTLKEVNEESKVEKNQVIINAKVEVASEKLKKNRKKHWNKFWNTIRDNIETWWD